MLQAGRGDASAGFTLLEMVCVLAVVALLAFVVLPRPQTRTSRYVMEQVALRIAGALKADRYQAIRQRTAVATLFDIRDREVRRGSSPLRIAIPADLTIRATVSGSCPATEIATGLTFYPDGRSCGGTVDIARDGGGFQVRVNWLTGGVEIVTLPVT